MVPALEGEVQALPRWLTMLTSVLLTAFLTAIATGVLVTIIRYFQ